MSKIYVSANQLLADAFKLTRKIIDDDFKPTALIALWRGGTPIGIGIHEGLSYLGINAKHFALRTSYYDESNQRKDAVQIDQIGIFGKQLSKNDRLLLVDDVFDTGNTLQAVINKLNHDSEYETPAEIRIATAYFKPTQNQTSIKPDYFLHETKEWIVFPHELTGLSKAEILQNKPDASHLFNEQD